MREIVSEAVQWDVGNWSPALDFWSAHAPLGEHPLDCLELGANSGGITMWLAAQGHHVVCSDLRETERRARPLIERRGLLDRVSFQDINATSIPYISRFDVVVFKSLLGAVGYESVDDQRAAIGAMHAALRPGGVLLFAENLAGSMLHRYLRRHYVRWGNRWRYVTIDQMREFLRPFRRVQFDTTGFFGTLGRSESQRRMLAAIDRVAVNALVPSSWRYVMYGVAVK